MSERIPSDRRRQATALFVCCWAAFLIDSFGRVPVPGINEPHYLGMAKAYWNPGWCRGDLFLESSRPHRAFYLLIGWLTQTFTLEQTAIIGRISSLGLVAWGWSRLCLALRLSIGQSILAATLLLLIQSVGSWSGEWLIGGVESKVFSYGLVFGAWGALLEGRRNAAGIWLGMATTLHPIVGIWATVATLCAAAWRWWREAGEAARTNSPLPRIPIHLVPALWWIICAAPGIGWALPALKAGDAATAGLADFIQVSYRLAHHLDPWTFPAASHWLFVGLLLNSLLTWWLQRSRPGLRLIDSLTAAAVLFGLAATALSYGPRPWSWPQSGLGELQLKLLKFYPFRLADLMAAVAVAVRLPVLPWKWLSTPIGATALAGIALTAALLIPGTDQRPGGLAGQNRNDWIATLRWIDASAAPDALLFASNEDFAVKWWANRAEYVNFKDCPQDAPGVVEWNNRLLRYSRWTEFAFARDGRVSSAELNELHRQTGVTHLIVSTFGPIDARPAFQQGRFKVFLIGEQ